MQYAAAAEKGLELAKDLATFTRAHPVQTAFNKLSLYQALKEAGSDFKMARRYYRKIRRRFAPRRRRYGLKRITGKRKRMSAHNTKRKRMISSFSVSKAAQQVPTTGIGDFINLGQLYFKLLNEPAPSSDGRDFNVRDNANVFYKGYKMCRLFQTTNLTSPIELHYALVQWEPQVYFRLQQQAGDLTLNIREEFFRAFDNVGDRHQNFTQYPTTGAALWNMRLNCSAMNPNRGYRIIWHKKRVLYPRYPLVDASGANQAVDGGRRWYWKIDRYLKVNKNFTFRTREETVSNTPFMEMWWANTLVGQDMPASDPGSFEVGRTYNSHTLYFREQR